MGLSGLSGLSGLYGAASPIIAGLVSHWSFGEASGTRADDFGGNTLTDNNTVTQAVGKIGNCGQFTAANSEFLSRADNAALSMGDIDFTIGAWVYLDTKAAIQRIIGKWAAAQNEYLLDYSNSSDRFRFTVRDAANAASALVAADAFGSVAVSTWHLVIAWHDSVRNEIGITVNAGPANLTAHAGGCRDGTSAFEIGSGGASNFFNGRIDEPFVWKRVLTAPERTWLYNGGAGQSWAAIAAYQG